jgi:hypothetical protein
MSLFRRTPLITQAELTHAHNLALMIAAAQAQLRSLAAEHAAALEAIDQGLAQGHKIERGPLTARIQTTEGKRSVSWKTEFMRVAGPAAAEQILAEVSISLTREVIIERTGN